MQLTRTTTAKSDEHKHGNKYGNLPKNESGENTFGNFSAGWHNRIRLPFLINSSIKMLDVYCTSAR